MPDDDALTEIHIPDTVLIEYVPDDELPANWDALIDHPDPQTFGGQWVAEFRSCVLSVPSSILPSERNLILNPAHKDFGTNRLLIATNLHIRSAIEEVASTAPTSLSNTESLQA